MTLFLNGGFSSRRASHRWLPAVALAVAAAGVSTPGASWAQGEKRDVALPEAKPLPQAKGAKKTVDEPAAPKLGGERFVRRKTERMVEEKWQEAFKLLKKLIQATPDADPSKPDLYFRLSEMHWERAADMNIRAFDAEEACLQQNKPANVCKAERERLLQASKKYRDQALEIYKHIVKSFPRYPRLDAVLFALAFNFQQKGQPENAKKIYIELIKRYPQSEKVPDTLLNVGEIFFDDGKVDQAGRAYKKVVDSYPDARVYGYALYKYGWTLYNQGNYTEAMRAFLKVVEHTNRLKASGQRANRLTLRNEALRDLVRTYVHIEGANPTRAIGFFRKVAPDEYLDLSEKLALLYSDTGKWDESNRLYRELIKLNKDSYKVVSYQRQISFNTRNMGKEVQAVKELKRLVTLWRTVKDAKDAEPERVAKDRKGIEEQLYNMAVHYHRLALKTKNPEHFSLAYDLYKDYVETFPDQPRSYDTTFFFAELLFELEKWKEAATNYERALALKADGKYTEDAAHGAVLAYKRLLDVKQDAGGGELDKVTTAEKEKSIPQPKAIPEDHQRYIKAIDLYRKYVKKSEHKIDIQYEQCRIYYDFNHFDKAIPCFKEIAENHKDHRLAVFSANLLLDTYNLQNDVESLNQQVERFLGLYTRDRDPEFYALLIKLKQQATFKKCTAIEREKRNVEAARCFKRYAAEFPQSEYADEALYNCGLNYERAKRIESSIQCRLTLVNNFGESELVPKALYQIAGNLHALAIFSKAADAYEFYGKNFSKTEEAKDAIKNAAIFREYLSELEKAGENYTLYLKLVDDKQKKAEVYFALGGIYEKQAKAGGSKRDWDKVIRHFKKFLSSYGKVAKPDLVIEAHTRIGNAYAAKDDQRDAQKYYADAYATFNALPNDLKEGLTTGRAAVAEARYKMGEAIFREFQDFKLKVYPYKNVKKFVSKMSEKIAAKTKLITDAREIYLEVIEFRSPNWAIHALARIGQMFQTLANDIYELPAPGSFNDEQVELFKGSMAEKAVIPEGKAVDSYVICLKKAQELKWVNDSVDTCERQLAKLKPSEYRYSDEIRSHPTHFGEGSVRQDFILELEQDEEAAAEKAAVVSK